MRAGVRAWPPSDYAGALLQWELVRIRTKEPNGYLGRARALIGLGRVDEARAALELLRAGEWPEHFPDLQREVEALERELPRRG